MAQPLQNKEVSFIHYGVLPDKGYSIETLEADAKLKFLPNDSLRPAQATRYWLKGALINPSNYTQTYRLTVWPNYDNTFYYVNADTKEWTASRVGNNVPADKNPAKGQFPLVLQGQKTTVFYVQINLGTGHLPKAVNPRIKLENAAIAQEIEGFFSIAWIVSLTVLLVLFLNNLHLYYRFRDRTILYFLISQLGGILYITAYRYFFKVIFPAPLFSWLVLPNGVSYTYDINALIMHVSVAIILFGVIQMARVYLQTNISLPRLDAALRIGNYGYLVFTGVVALVNISGFYLDYYTLVFDNILVLLLTGVLIVTSLVAYQRKLPLANTFIYAHVLPLLLLMSVAAYHVFFNLYNNGQIVLPDLVIISQALCFSVAIVTRMHTLRENLQTKEAEANRLGLDIKQLETNYFEIVQENKQIQTAFRETALLQRIKDLETQQLSIDILEEQAAKKELEETLEANQRELAAISLYMEQKNAMLAQLKSQMEDLNKFNPNNKQEELAGVKSLLNANLYLDEDWNKFKVHFEQVHPHFFKELQEKYPTLTKNELRLYCYFHINLSTKEIAGLLNIEPASVRRAKTRLYKKIAAIDKGENIPESDSQADGLATNKSD